LENVDFARVFDEIADLLEILEANPFRVRAYRMAARRVESWREPIAAVAERGAKALAEIPGIGEDLAAKIVELAGTGRLAFLEELRRKVPAGLAAMLRVPGLGPKRTRMLWKRLGVEDLDGLAKAARAGRLRELPGFGEKLAAKVLSGVRAVRASASRTKIVDADAYVASLLRHLEGARGTVAIEVAGSWRRRRETVGDLDVVAACREGSDLKERFLGNPDVAEVLATGPTRASVRLRSGLQVDLRTVSPESFGAALHYFTGSKAHNIAVRKIARGRGLKVNEYGVFRGARRVGGRTEREVFAAAGMAFVPPELREDRGEIEAARARKLPRLLAPEDIRGDLQMHSTWSDGEASVAAMAEACRARGYAYMAITDHGPTLRIARGLSPADFRKQYREVDRLNARLRGFRVLKSAEVEILPDGSLELRDDLLDAMDVVLASVHTSREMPRAAMTRRIVRALASGRVHVLAHPTGRLVNARAPYAVDLPEVFRAAAGEGVLLELNAHPDRLDLPDVDARAAKDAGCRFVISTDAHRPADLAFMRYGVDQARRAWLTKADVANTRPLREFLDLLRR
jgi:DNA polymerase (family 10)